MVHSSILLEACIENQTKGPLVLDYVRFDPSPQLSVETIQAPPEPSTSAPADSGPLDQYIRDLQVRTAPTIDYALQSMIGPQML